MSKSLSHSVPTSVNDLSILSLEVVGFKRIRAARLTLTDGVTVIAGNNGQGKTSVIDALQTALAGGRSIPEMPVHDGEDEAVITVEMPGFHIKRTIAPDRKTKLIVTRPDGTEVGTPQAWLDSLVGPVAFDPLQFSRMDAKQRADLLRQLVGLDLSDLVQQRAQFYDQRTAVGRERDRKKARYEDEMPFYPDAPAVEVSVAELGEALQMVSRHNDTVKQAQRDADRWKEAADMAANRCHELQSELERMTAQHEKAQQEEQAARTRMAELGGMEDTQPILDEIGEAEQINVKVRANAEREHVISEYRQFQDEYEQFTAAIARLDAEKKRRLAEVVFPVDGLSFDEEGGVLFNDRPFDNASGAEKLRVSTAIAMKMNPHLKIAFVRDGSLLDLDGLRIVDEEVKRIGGQVLMERVGKGEEAHLIIEDGMIAEDRTLEVAA